MDDMLMDVFVRQVLTQAQYVVWAHDDLNVALRASRAKPDWRPMSKGIEAVRKALLTQEILRGRPDEYPDEKAKMRRAETLVRSRFYAAQPEGRIWYSIQQMLTAGANISKAFYGHNPKVETERQPLRDALGVPDPDKLWHYVNRKMRNNFDHFDGMLTTWWERDPMHLYIDTAIGESTSVSGVPAARESEFRAYNPHTGDLTFWGEAYNLDELRAGADALLSMAARPLG